MAENLLLLKGRKNTAQNIAQIAKAMEMIAASKIKRAQSTVENHKPYAQKIQDFTSRLLLNTDSKQYRNPFLERNEAPGQWPGDFSSSKSEHPSEVPPGVTEDKSAKKLLIFVTPDRGLCGSLNTNLAKKFFEVDRENTYVITLGNRGERLASRLGFEIIASYPMGARLPDYATTYQILKIIEEYYLSGKVGEVEFLFPEFNSIFSQIPTIQKLLPLESLERTSDSESTFTFEPNLKALLDDLIPHLIEIKIYDVITQSYTSEQAARMMAMQNAKNNALDVASYLTLLYNKSRQERITNELLDISNSQALNA